MNWMTALEAIVTGALGGIGAVFGLSRFLGNLWIERQKATYSRELEELKNVLQNQQKRVQAELDRSVFVTRAHFETEFDALKKVFKVLSQVRLRLNGIRPSFEVSPAGEEQKEKLKRLSARLNDLIAATNELTQMVEEMKPFYPENVYEAIDDSIRAARVEIIGVQTRGEDTFTISWYEDGDRNRDKFHLAYSRATNIIRERISSLAVLPIR
jgi:hypothetical protein